MRTWPVWMLIACADPAPETDAPTVAPQDLCPAPVDDGCRLVHQEKDADGDGVVDELTDYTYQDGVLVGAVIDRAADGTVEYELRYTLTASGGLRTVWVDEDGDGVAEVTGDYDWGRDAEGVQTCAFEEVDHGERLLGSGTYRDDHQTIHEEVDEGGDGTVDRTEDNTYDARGHRLARVITAPPPELSTEDLSTYDAEGRRIAQSTRLLDDAEPFFVADYTWEGCDLVHSLLVSDARITDDAVTFDDQGRKLTFTRREGKPGVVTYTEAWTWTGPDVEVVFDDDGDGVGDRRWVDVRDEGGHLISRAQYAGEALVSHTENTWVCDGG